MGVCPSSHEYAFFDGKYCCQTADSCEESENMFQSRCCQNDEFLECDNDSCVNHQDAPEKIPGNVMLLHLFCEKFEYR